MDDAPIVLNGVENEDFDVFLGYLHHGRYVVLFLDSCVLYRS